MAKACSRVARAKTGRSPDARSCRLLAPTLPSRPRAKWTWQRSQVGSRLAGRIDEQRLRQGFAGLIVLVALYILARTLLGPATVA